MFEFYSKFGEIQKCKLEVYADGLSRGFAYVQYKDEKDAQEAINKTNGAEFMGKKLEVFAHVKRSDANDDKDAAKHQGNNIFVQGFTKGTTEQQLKDMFKVFGEITSAVVQKGDSGDSLSNSAYVCFKNAQSATQAVEKMNKQKNADGSYLFVNHHVAKRQNELATDKTKTAINQNINKNFSSNLFVKFIPATVTEGELHKLFSQHGNIISIKLKVRGDARFNQAYVLYESVEMCQQAIRALDKTRPFGNHPIDVEFWVSKVDLQAEREAKQKEQMQKFFSSAIYEIKNEMMGGRKPFRQNKRNNQPRTGTAGGRGGKQMQSSERKASRGKSANKDQKQVAAPTLAQQNTTFVQVPLPSPQQLQQITPSMSLDEKKQAIGNLIYPCI